MNVRLAIAGLLSVCGLMSANAWAETAPLAELCYVRPDGSRVVYFQLLSDGTATADVRGEQLTTRLSPSTVQRVRERLRSEPLCGVSQARFDELIKHGARRYAIVLPVPLADRCEIRLPEGRSLACVGPAVLSARMQDVNEVQDFDRIRREMEQLAAVVVLGGPESLREFLQVAGDAAGRPIALSSLTYADTFAGERVAHFHTSDPGSTIIVVTAVEGRTPAARVIQTASR